MKDPFWIVLLWLARGWTWTRQEFLPLFRK